MNGIKEVAKAAGVSISTVSNVLNRKKYVSPELTKKVEEAVKQLDYKVNPVARSMKSRTTGMIGVITEDFCGLFYPYVIRGISEVAEQKGYQLVICDAHGTRGDSHAVEREKELFRKLFNNRVDGVIFVSTVSARYTNTYFESIKRMANQYKKTPLVSLERNFASAGIDSVYFDGYANAKMAVSHLIDCGCRKIGHISGPKTLFVAKERIKGYEDCLKENNMGGFDGTVEGDYTHSSGYKGMEELLERLPDIDGVFCANDQTAIGAIMKLQEAGKRIPADVKVIGYDDVFVSGVINPPISTVHIQKRHAGTRAAEVLFKRIEETVNSGEEYPPEEIKMEGRLVVRRSTVADF
ncbi:MAG: LacI family transcriptional regulator [Lachnospiraceae bacterium]|nr:LacI family transcriptional regulator [Lachnospiraceae bacterium]